jgi:transposase
MSHERPSSELPADLAGCHALIDQLHARLDEMQAEKQQFENSIATLKVEMQELLKQAFAKRRERYLHDPRQLSLDFPGNEDAADAADGLADAVADAGLETVPTHARKPKSRRRGSEQFPEFLPRDVVEAEVPAELRTCPQHGPRQIIGYDQTETMVYVPPQLRIRVTRYPKFACSGQPACGIASPERPTGLVEGDRYDAGVAAEVITAKFGYHLPLYRQQDMFAGSGWTPTRSTLANLLAASAFVLRPLADYFRRVVLESGRVGTDDTTVTLLVGKSIPEAVAGDLRSERAREMVAEAQAKGERSITARLWAYRSMTEPLVFFDFTVSRARAGPDLVLANFAGKLMADCYSAYQGIDVRSDGQIQRAACATHARRKIFEAKDAYPRLASLVLARFQQIYRVEALAAALAPDERHALRQHEAKPAWEALGAWLNTAEARDVLPKSKFGQALGYLRNHWDALQLYLTDPWMPADNNDVEQLMKMIAVGRKNWMFVGSVPAGQRTADFFSLVASAVRNDLDVWAYLKDVLERLLAGETNYARLRPDAWRSEHPAAVRQYRVEERRDKADRKLERTQRRPALQLP